MYNIYMIRRAISTCCVIAVSRQQSGHSESYDEGVLLYMTFKTGDSCIQTHTISLLLIKLTIDIKFTQEK